MAIGTERLISGTLAHRRIGEKTDHVLGSERLQRLLRLIILVLLGVLAVQLLGGALVPLAFP